MASMYDWAMEQVWAVTLDTLEAGLTIAARLNDPPDVVAERIGKPLENTHRVTVRDDYGPKIAVIPVAGPIFKKANLFARISGGTSAEVLAQDIRSALDDPEIRGIVLDIDSPGGEVRGTAELAQQIYEGRDRKPIVAHGDGHVASGAYWIGSATSSIVISPTTELGSIGIVQAVRPRNPKDTTVEYVSTFAPLKRFDPLSDAGKENIIARLNDTHEVFEAAVAKYRGVKVDRVRADFGQGGMLVGKRAIRAGMADAVLSLEATIKELAHGRTPGRSRYGPAGAPEPKGISMGWQRNFLKTLFGGDDEQTSEADDSDAIAAVAATLKPAPEPAPAQARASVATADAERVARLEAEVESFRKKERQAALDAIVSEAKTFASEQVKSSKAFPAEEQALMLAVANAALIDNGFADVVAVAGTDGSFALKDRKDAGDATFASHIRGIYEKRTPHRLTDETLPGADLKPVSPQLREDDGSEFDAAVSSYAARRYGK